LIVVGVTASVLVASTTYAAWGYGKVAPGYASPGLARSELARGVTRLPRSDLVATNNPYLLYFLTGRQPVVFSPGAFVPGLSVRPEPLSDLERHARCSGPVYWAWFSSPEVATGQPVQPDELARQVSLTAVRKFRDGTLYRLDVEKRGSCGRGDT
jgi:hypothetical protein